MRIREIFFHNVRSFRGEHRISFVEPLTDDARSFTVIAGTNGTGKTTIFDSIESLLDFASTGATSHPLVAEVIKNSGFFGLKIQLSHSEYKPSELRRETDDIYCIAVGQMGLGENWLQNVHENNLLCFLVDRTGNLLKKSTASPTHKQLTQCVILDLLDAPVQLAEEAAA